MPNIEKTDDNVLAEGDVYHRAIFRDPNDGFDQVCIDYLRHNE